MCCFYHGVLFLSPGIVDWLQALLHWCGNNTVFIVDVSKVCANFRPQRSRQETKASVNTHRISENFQSGT